MWGLAGENLRQMRMPHLWLQPAGRLCYYPGGRGKFSAGFVTDYDG